MGPGPLWIGVKQELVSRAGAQEGTPFPLAWSGDQEEVNEVILLPHHFSVPNFFRGKIPPSGIPVPLETLEDSGRAQ